MWILLHGFTGAPRSWNRVLDHAQLDPRPLIPALLGHERNWRSRDVESFEQEVTRLASAASSAGEPRLLCGYSMGARVGLGLLARRPRIFDGALLIGVHPGLTDEAARAERHAIDASRARSLREKGLETFVGAWEELPLFASQRELSQEVLAEQRDIRLAQDAEGLARALDVLGLAEMQDYRAAMASLQIPITLMTGSHDSKFSGIARALARENAHVDAKLVYGVGHNLVLEAPAAVAAELRSLEERARG